MNDPFYMTVALGGGLLLCGYILGKARGYNVAIRDNMHELMANKLIDPREVLNHYASQGNEKAQQALENLNRQRKREYSIKANKGKDNAED